MQQGSLETPVGRVMVSVDDEGSLLRVAFVDDDCEPVTPVGENIEGAVRQISEYFSGRRTIFELELAPEGSDFEHTVWKQLVRIPLGSTTSYGEIAERLGDPGASRAVGTANARNPIAVVIPCHRVIGSGGGLTGYAGGLWRKKWLLAHESGQQSLDFEVK